jgi:hypothetical protein
MHGRDCRGETACSVASPCTWCLRHPARGLRRRRNVARLDPDPPARSGAASVKPMDGSRQLRVLARQWRPRAGGLRNGRTRLGNLSRRRGHGMAQLEPRDCQVSRSRLTLRRSGRTRLGNLSCRRGHGMAQLEPRDCRATSFFKLGRSPVEPLPDVFVKTLLGKSSCKNDRKREWNRVHPTRTSVRLARGY